MGEFTKVLTIFCDFIQWHRYSKLRKKCEIIKEIQRARMGDTDKLEISFLALIL